MSASPLEGASIRELYRASLKPADSLFNLYLARPIAALFLPALLRSPLTPNQLSFLGFTLMVVACLVLAVLSGVTGIWIAVGLIELSYVIDCCDGQIARLKSLSSPVGAALDFMVDELKAYLLIGAISLRWFLSEESSSALLIGLAALIAFSSAISLTKFTRSDVYAEATGTVKVEHGSAAGERKGRWWPLRAGLRLITQYPASLPIFAFFGLGGLKVFLVCYGVLHLLYAVQSFLGITLQLARPVERSKAVDQE